MLGVTRRSRVEHLCAQKRCVHTGKACAQQQTSNPPQETVSLDWASQVDAGSGVRSPLRARGSSGSPTLTSRGCPATHWLDAKGSP